MWKALACKIGSSLNESLILSKRKLNLEVSRVESKKLKVLTLVVNWNNQFKNITIRIQKRLKFSIHSVRVDMSIEAVCKFKNIRIVII